MIKHVIFDFFGVISYSGKVGEIKIRSDILDIPEDKMKGAVMPYRDIINKGEMTIAKFWEHVAHDLAIEITQDPEELFYSTMQGVVVYEEILELVATLKSKGYICTLLSDVFAPDIKWIRKKGRYDNFDDLIFSSEIDLSKFSDVHYHTQKIFEYALEKYNIIPEEVMFIDDNSENCKAANRAGIQTVHATSPEYIISETQKILGINLD